MPLKNILKERFGKLVVIGREENAKDGTAKWLCLCVCGETRVVAGPKLRAGLNKSCGCSSPRFVSADPTVNGQSTSRTYVIWSGMKKRCVDPKSKKAHLYALKGIAYDPAWETFGGFVADMGEAPEGLTLDRRDGRIGYCKSNCRWATPKEQANNTSANVILTVGGRSQTAAMWADELGVKANTLIYRIRRGWTPEEVIGVPVVSRLPKAGTAPAYGGRCAR